MIPPTSPGADSTAAVEPERTLRLYATDGPAAVYVADPRVRRIVPADVLADAADEIEALRAALLRSQQEARTARDALRSIVAMHELHSPTLGAVCTVGHEMGRIADDTLRALNPHPETPSHE